MFWDFALSYDPSIGPTVTWGIINTWLEFLVKWSSFLVSEWLGLLVLIIRVILFNSFRRKWQGVTFNALRRGEMKEIILKYKILFYNASQGTVVLGKNVRLLYILSDGSRDRIPVFLFLLFVSTPREKKRKSTKVSRNEERRKAGAARWRRRTGRRFRNRRRMMSSFEPSGARV